MRGREEQSSPMTRASSQGFRIVHNNKRHKISLVVGATHECLKTTFDGLGETMLHTQSSVEFTYSTTHSTTSHEQNITQTIRST